MSEKSTGVYFCDYCRTMLRDLRNALSLSFHINKSHYLAEFSTVSNYWHLLKLSNPGKSPDRIFESYDSNIIDIKDLYNKSLKYIENMIFL
jgi:hypothetical protein